jgi:hypothetical protein
MAYETGVSVGVGCDGVVLVLAVSLILTCFLYIVVRD